MLFYVFSELASPAIRSPGRSGRGEGWLTGLGVWDLTGGTGVHLSLAVYLLVACLIFGPGKTEGVDFVHPKGLLMSIIEKALLRFGSFGFNEGGASSVGEVTGNEVAVAHVASNKASFIWRQVK